MSDKITAALALASQQIAAIKVPRIGHAASPSDLLALKDMVDAIKGAVGPLMEEVGHTAGLHSCVTVNQEAFNNTLSDAFFDMGYSLESAAEQMAEENYEDAMTRMGRRVFA